VLADRLRPAVGNLPPMLAKTLDVDDMVDQWRTLRSEVEERARQARAEREAARLAEQRTDRRSPWWRRLGSRG
jgi:hypothetical protein